MNFKNSFKQILTASIFIFLFAFLIFLFSVPALAQVDMSNSDYTVHFGNLNSFAGKPTNSNYKLGITGGQIAPGLYSGTNYKVRAGFQYLTQRTPFSFSISSIFIDFGPLAPGTPVTRTNNLTITNNSAYGYSVLVRENHPLRVNATGVSIPDTTCDSGTCTETSSAVWTSVLTYGFGYRCDDVSGTNCVSDFSTPNTYKQFASSESAELAQPVMTGTSGKNLESQITYKANVSATQPAGEYENQITYIAVPSI